MIDWLRRPILNIVYSMGGRLPMNATVTCPWHREAALCFLSLKVLLIDMSLKSLKTSAEPFSHGTETLRCLHKEMATYRHWSMSLWRDSDDVPHCWILSPDKTEWRLISATLADEDAVWWLTSYGSWHAYEKKKCQLWRLLSYRKKIFFPVLQKWYVMLHGTVVERWSLTGELSLPCARPPADWWPLM